MNSIILLNEHAIVMPFGTILLFGRSDQYVMNANRQATDDDVHFSVATVRVQSTMKYLYCIDIQRGK